MMTGENAQTSQLTVVDHPLVADRITRLRDASTPSDDYRRLFHQLTLLVLPHALSDLAVRQVEVATPLETTSGARLSNDVMFVGILRAALTMVGAALEIVPEASVGYLGLERDHTTHLANEYYNKVPQTDGARSVVLLDPMLATGGSAVHALDVLAAQGIQNVTFCGIIGCPEGVAAVHEAHPNTHVVLAALDRQLNENCYILPGLGDAGDRSYRT